MSPAVMYVLIFATLGLFMLGILIPIAIFKGKKLKKTREIIVNRGWVIQDKPFNIKFPIFDRSRPARLAGVKVKFSSTSPDGAIQQEFSEYGWLLLMKYWPMVCLLKTEVNASIPRLVFMYGRSYFKPTASDPDAAPVAGIDDPNFLVFSSSRMADDAATAELAKRLLPILGDNQVNVEFADGELYILRYDYLTNEESFESLEKLVSDLRTAVQ